MASMAAIQQLQDRAIKLEAKNKRRAMEERLTMEKVVGFGAAGISSVLAGYVDGKFDLADGEAGDGTKLLGIPVMPIVSGITSLGGLWLGGSIGSALAYSGLGIGCGWAYKSAATQGAKSG